jgi:hypothetical protein
VLRAKVEQYGENNRRSASVVMQYGPTGTNGSKPFFLVFEWGGQVIGLLIAYTDTVAPPA